MKTSVVKIGNSRGIRLPQTILKQCHIEKEVDLQVKNDYILIKPLHLNKPRENWDIAFSQMNSNNDDTLIIDDSVVDLDNGDWEW